MIELQAAFRAVVDAFRAAEVAHVVVGSTASSVWGVARMTRDVDVVAVISSEALERVLISLESRGDIYVPVAVAREAARSGGSFNVLHTNTGGKVDVFVALASDEFTSSRLARRVEADVMGCQTWIASAEDVVLAKLRWRLESRSEIQWRDCVEIAATQQLDRGYLWAWAARLGIVDDLADLLGEPQPSNE